MSGPRTKRQFTGAASDPAQRQITSFFQRSSASSSSFALSSSPAESPAPLNGPVLPGHVQTNLLNVGMRVRKAVPEGYKTGTQYSAFKLWEDDTVPAPSVAAPVSATPNPIAARGMHELIPFCGLHKVGGLGVQEPSSVGGATATTAKDFSTYDFPMLGSQGSTISNDSTTSALEATGRAMNTNGKRLFVEAEDNDDGTGDFPETWSFDEGSRVLAVPRRRQGNANKSSAMMEQENAAAGPNGNDFEEAEFLQYEMEVEP